MLAEKVKAGELPPVDERLPEEPFVVGPGVLITEEDLPDWQPGEYGGTLRSAHSVANWAPDVFVMMNEPLLMAPGIGVQGVRGNVLKDFEVNEDNTEFTFYMRKGLKWSDGEPVTTEDVRFVYEDILLNEQLTPVFPARFRTGARADGEPMKLEIIDDYTFKVSFPEPYGGFLRQLTIESWVGYTELLRPSHYLKQFHPKYTPMEELKPLLEEQNLTEEWWNLFNLKDCTNWEMTNPQCVNYPALNPWIGVPSQPGVLAFERNPYYFKVDTEGKQLPYIDKIVSVQVEDVEMVNLKVLTGEVDFLRESTALVKVPLYKENEDKAGFRVVLLDMHVDSSSLEINQTFEDETWRSVVRDLRFRQAVSLAINRPEIIESIYYGFASLPLKTVGEEFSQYDPQRANALLDEIGMTERDSEGYRLAPNGQPFTILVEHGAHAPDLAPVAELISEHLKDVGLRVQVKQIDPQLWSQRRNANELMSTVFWSHDRGWDADNTLGNINRAGRLWEIWRTTAGQEGEEPPDWVKEGIELAAKTWSSIPGSDEYNQLKEQSYAWERANLPLINIVENVKYPMIASQRLGNIPRSGYAIAANFSAEQFFYKK
ncbi:MAG: ABC transporter substrate-binding protein [Anaerolineae bacterium]